MDRKWIVDTGPIQPSEIRRRIPKRIGNLISETLAVEAMRKRIRVLAGYGHTAILMSPSKFSLKGT